MNAPSPDPRQQSDDIALLWVTRIAAEPGNAALEERLLPAADQFELRRWLAADPVNAQAYADARQLWQVTGMAAMRLAEDEDASLQAILKRARRPRRSWPVAMAAAVLLAAMLALVSQPERWLDDLQADYHSAPGELRAVTLADGSEVLLDGDSAIDVSLTERSRNIHLRRGAAFFQVKHTGQPFIVHAGEGEVRVLGTRFEVRREPQGGQVTVEEGKVAVKANSQAFEQHLTAAQGVAYRSGHAGPVQHVNAEQAFGWREGRLSFRHQPLAQALEVVQRYYPGRILLLNEQLGKRLVSGDFATHDPQAMLAAFQSVLGYSQQHLPGGTVVIH